MKKVRCLDERTEYIQQDTGINGPQFELKTRLVLDIEGKGIQVYEICTMPCSRETFKTTVYTLTNIETRPISQFDGLGLGNIQEAMYLRGHFGIVASMRTGMEGLQKLIEEYQKQKLQR